MANGYADSACSEGILSDSLVKLLYDVEVFAWENGLAFFSGVLNIAL